MRDGIARESFKCHAIMLKNDTALKIVIELPGAVSNQKKYLIV